MLREIILYPSKYYEYHCITQRVGKCFNQKYNNTQTPTPERRNKLDKSAFDTLRNLAFCRLPPKFSKCKDVKCNEEPLKTHDEGKLEEKVNENDDAYVVFELNYHLQQENLTHSMTFITASYLKT